MSKTSKCEFVPACSKDFVNLRLATVEGDIDLPYIVHNKCEDVVEYISIADSFMCLKCKARWDAVHFDTNKYDRWTSKNFKIFKEAETVLLIEYNDQIGCFMSKEVSREEIRGRTPKTPSEVFGVW